MQEIEPSFEDLGVTRQFINAMEDMGFVRPTPIQIQALPRLRSGQDLIGIAQTGTGKTAAFVLPILMRLKYAQGEAPRAVILAPTKELVLQTVAQAKDLAKYTDLRIAGLYGGANLKVQREHISAGLDIIVATPGRLLEFYSQGLLILRKIEVLVLDEADRMMDMGFLPQLRQLLEVLPVKRQNLLFSATFENRVEELSAEFLEHPTKVEVSKSATPAETIDQQLVPLLNFRTKLVYLESILLSEEISRMIVFCRTKDRANQLHRYLERKISGGVSVIHSNKGQNTRINAFNAFRAGELRVLVATDVGARGIDVAAVSHVVNFDVPRTVEDYTHRIGRTGRADQSGIAITLVDRSEMYYVKKIEARLGHEIERKSYDHSGEQLDYLPGEEKDMLRAIDYQKQREDPSYKGGFHKRKAKSATKKAGGRSKSKRR